jgi:hypothetical protein
VTDAEFIEAFEACTLPSTEFHHRHHVRLAFLLFQREPFIEAAKHFIASLKRYATSLGSAGLYHETITWAYLVAIHERMNRGASGDWETFARANADLFEKTFLERYYRPETLQSEMARRVFVMPDRRDA